MARQRADRPTDPQTPADLPEGAAVPPPSSAERPPETRVPGEGGDLAADAPPKPPEVTAAQRLLSPPTVPNPVITLTAPAGSEADRLRAENERLREQLAAAQQDARRRDAEWDRRVDAIEARQREAWEADERARASVAASAVPVADPPPARAGGPVAPDDPANGRFLWSGRLLAGAGAKVDPYGPVIRFRTDSTSEAEAREAYLRFAGVIHTEHRVDVERLEG